MSDSDNGSEPEQSPKRGPTIGNFNVLEAEIAMTFQLDCERLFQKFKDRKNYHFMSFAECWRESCFSAIFEGQKSISLLFSFLENAFIIIKLFLDSADYYTKLGAFYTLYGVYYKQPIQTMVKIRLTLDDTKKIISLLDFMRSHNVLEPLYIWHKMRFEGALNFVAFPQFMAPHGEYDRRFNLGTDRAFFKSTAESFEQRFEDFIANDPNLKELEQIQDEYQTLMNKLKERYPGLTDAFSSKLLPEIDQIRQEFRKLDNTNETADDDNNSVLSRRKQIKEQAMASNTSTYRAERDVITALDKRPRTYGRRKVEPQPSTSQDK